ncbi:MAG TPA: ACT domain-containing protein [Bacteroidota bacterium]|jgi:hypothetical protein|nr:ACT domain-containing protein [Bacteroidota bacterium]
MTIKQLSVFLENTSGRLAEVTRILADAKINISAFSLADTADYGILRLIVDDPVRAEKMLHEQGCTVHTTDVVGIYVPHKPGGLYKALVVLAENGISIEYMYAFASREKAMVILRTENIAHTIEALQKSGIEILNPSDAYNA